MNYFDYIFKCVIRNIIRMIFKPRNLIIIVVILLLFLLVSYSPSHAFEGNNTYTDKNSTIKMSYDSICSDFIQRLDFSSSGTDKNNLLKYLKDSNYSYYIFYGNSNGSDMISSSQYQPQYLRIIFYSNNDKNVVGTIQETYQGMTTNISSVSNLAYYFYFNGNNLFSDSVPSSVYIPYVLINYHSNIIIDYLTNSSEKQTNDIVGAINEQTNTIQEQTQVIEETQQFIQNDTITESEMNVSTEGMQIEDNNNILDFIKSTLLAIRDIFNNIDDDVQTIEIPLPNGLQSLVLRSDIISRHIQGTFIYTLIQTLWYFVFGTYLMFYIRHIINFFSTGEFAYSGLAQFIEHLEDNDVIIRSTMM